MTIYRVNMDLTQKTVSPLSTILGGEVIYGRYDLESTKPRITWLGNVFPTTEGLISVSPRQQITADALPAGLTIDPSIRTDCSLIWNADSEVSYYIYLDGKHLVFDPINGEWGVVQTAISQASNPTLAYLKGKTYLFHIDFGIGTFADDFTSITPLTLQGINPLTVLGMSSANNYLLLWDNDTLYWSSPADPTEFRPIVDNIPTGAGSSKVQAVLGNIKYCLPMDDGFIIYSEFNATSSRYSGSSSNPWIFREVKDSAGIADSEHVSYEANSSQHFVWSSSGLQLISKDTAQDIFPELSDFLAGNRIERLGAEGLPEIGIIGLMSVKIALISGRYFCISYGEVNKAKEGIYVYDISLERWGRAIVDHLDLFEFADPQIKDAIRYSDLLGTYSSYKNVRYKFWAPKFRRLAVSPNNIGIVTPDGGIQFIDLAEPSNRTSDDVGAEATLIIGDLRVTRDKFCTLTESLLYGNLDQVSMIENHTEINGKVYKTKFVPNPKDANKFLNLQSGESHRVAITGRFNLTNLVFSLKQDGVI